MLTPDELIAFLQKQPLPATRESLSESRSGMVCLCAHYTRAVDVWKILRGFTEQTGYYPVIIGRVERRDWLWEDSPDNLAEKVAVVLTDAGDATIEKWFAEAEEDEDFDEDEWEGFDEEAWEAGEQNGVAAVPYEIPPYHGAPEDYCYKVQRPSRESRTPEDCWLVLIPTRNSFEALAYLRFGNWNACPPDEVHVALLKRWHEEYGAEIWVVTEDVIEARVSRPPQTIEAARELAREQYAYCSDIVDQGTQTIEKLAEGLMNSPTWFFWWD